MNTVYSTFDALVEEAAQPDDALWKVETVRYAAMFPASVASASALS